MAQPTQVLPYWLSASTSYYTAHGVVLETTVVVNLPLTYYGPSIPLGTGWVFGGSTSPAPTPTHTRSAMSSSDTLTPSAIPTTAANSVTATAATSASASRSSSAASVPASITNSVTASSGSTTLPGASTPIPSTGSLPTVSGTSSPFASASDITPTPSASSSGASTTNVVPFTSPSPIAASSASATPSVIPSSLLTSNSLLTASTTSNSLLAASSTTASPTWPQESGALQSENASHGLSRGTIIAISTIFGALGLLLLLGCCLVFLLRSRREPNKGRPLSGDLSGIPAGYGDEHEGEQGSLLGGRLSGGASPDPQGYDGQMQQAQIAGMPIAQRYLNGRRSGGARGSYQPLEGAAAAVAAMTGAVVDAARRNSQSGSSHRSSSLSHSGSGSSGRQGRLQPTGGGMADVEEQDEDAELVVAQTATRGPLARLARLSWFQRNRGTLGTSMAATGGFTATPMTENDEDWVTVQSPRARNSDGRRHSMTSPLLSPPLPAERASSPNRSAVVLPGVGLQPPPRLTSPPPTSYLSPANRPDNSRRISDQSTASGQTAFFDAPSRPQSPPQQSPPPEQSPADSDSPGGPTPADFPPPPAHLWPRFSAAMSSPEVTTPGTGDYLDSPVPRPYARSSLTTTSGGPSQLSAPWAALAAYEAMKRKSAPDLTAGISGHGRQLTTLDEGPPEPQDSWRSRLAPQEMTNVGTPRLVTRPPEDMPASLHATASTYAGTGSSRPVASSLATSGDPRSTFSSGPRMPSLTAIGGSRMGGTEMGELEKRYRPPGLSLAGHLAAQPPDVETPPPPPSASQEVNSLSPPPPQQPPHAQARSWWRM